MVSVFETLASAHAGIEHLLVGLDVTPTVAESGNRDDVSVRKTLAGQLVRQISAHERAEEMRFWPAMRERLPDGMAEAVGLQERELKDILGKLDRIDCEPRNSKHS